MRIVQILGSGRNCGKTTLGCAILAAFPTLRWIAVKVTPHSHSIDATLTGKDTDRFHRAGAAESHLLPAPITPASFHSFVGRADAVLVESGQPLAGLRWRLLRLAIAPADASLWKPGFAERRMHVDALILTGSGAVASDAILQPAARPFTAQPCTSRPFTAQPFAEQLPLVFHASDAATLPSALHACIADFLNGKT